MMKPRIWAIVRTTGTLFIGAALLFTLYLSFRSLYLAPVPDSIRWGGDETWLMREFKQQATHGVMQYPESYDAEPRTDGVLAGSMWVEALLYGGIGAVLHPHCDYVSIGRTVTVTLSVMLLGLLVWALIKRGVSRLTSLSAALLLAANMTFFYASHSARYDILTGLALLAWVLCCESLIRKGELSRPQAILFGAASVLTIIFSRHMLTLALPTTMLTFFLLKPWKKALLVPMLGATLITIAGLCGAYLAGAGSFSLFGNGGGMGNYSFVLQQLPILRPFSRSVQVSNLMERVSLLWIESPVVLVVLLIALLVLFGSLLSPKYRSGLMQVRGIGFFIFAGALSFGSWLLLQGARPYYTLHILPLLLFVAALVTERFPSKYAARLVLPILALFSCVISYPLFLLAAENGSQISHDQREVMQRFSKAIQANYHGTSKPRVLSEVAGLNWMLSDSTVEVVTLDVFQPPPSSPALISKLRGARIDYVYLRSGAEDGTFEPGRALLPRVLDSVGLLMRHSTGRYYDDFRAYDKPLTAQLDTLTLYKLNLH